MRGFLRVLGSFFKIWLSLHQIPGLVGKRIPGPAGKSRPNIVNILNNIFHICSNVFSNPLSSIYNSSCLPTRKLITVVTGDQKGAPLVTGEKLELPPLV